MSTLDQETDRQLAAAPVSPTKLAHIVFRTARFAEMCSFWKTLLNAHAVHENEGLAFLSFDEEHHRVAIANMPFLEGKPAVPFAGFEHVAFTFPTLGSLLGTYRRLKAEAIKPIWCINHGMTTSIYYMDPDGNQIELQFDNIDNDAADVFMHSEYFALNPIGVDFDPELLIGRYERGDPMEELIRQGSALPPADVELPQPKGMIPYDRRGELLGAGMGVA